MGKKDNDSVDHSKQKQTRRKFLGSLALKAASLGAITTIGRRLGFTSQAQQKSVLATIKLSEHPELNHVGGSVLIKKSPRGELLIIRSEEAKYTALSNVCPHRGCHVEVKSKDLMRCPCHHSTYKLDGTYISGPAHASLRKFMFSQDGDLVTIVDADAAQ